MSTFENPKCQYLRNMENIQFEDGESLRAQRFKIVPIVDEYLRISSSIVDRAVLAAIYDAPRMQGWKFDIDESCLKYLFSEGRNVVEVMLYALEDEDPSDDEFLSLLGKFNDLTCDILLLHQAYWRRSIHNGIAWITPEAILESRGIKPKTRKTEKGCYRSGHRTEDCEEILRNVDLLLRLGVRVKLDKRYAYQVKDEHPGKLIMATGSVLCTVAKIPDQNVGKRVRGWAYNMYEGLSDAIDVKPYAYISREIIMYDHMRRVMEKRFGRYLAIHFRLNAGETICRNIGIMLKSCGIHFDRKRPRVIRERLEYALGFLTHSGMTSNWHYRLNHGTFPWLRTKELALSSRPSLEHWLELTVEIDPNVNIPKIKRAHKRRQTR